MGIRFAWQQACPNCGTVYGYDFAPFGLLLSCTSCGHTWVTPDVGGNVVFNPDVTAWQAMVRLADADQKYEAMWKLVDWTADLLDDPQRSKEDVRDWLRALLANR